VARRPPKPADRPRTPRFKPKPTAIKSAQPSPPKRRPTASKRLLKELPSEDAMFKIVAGLRKKGHQTTAILGAAYLERVLELLLRTHFRVLNKEDDTRMFDGAGGGILGSFSAKIRIAYAMKLLHEKPYHDLMLINDIRNLFAHSLHGITFNNKLVAEDCDSFKSNTEFYRPIDGEKPIDKFASKVNRLYVSLRFAVSRMREEL
jgi:hypothetical protein